MGIFYSLQEKMITAELQNSTNQSLKILKLGFWLPKGMLIPPFHKVWCKFKITKSINKQNKTHTVKQHGQDLLTSVSLEWQIVVGKLGETETQQVWMEHGANSRISIPCLPWDICCFTKQAVILTSKNIEITKENVKSQTW